MSKQTYALERGGGDALEISWRSYFHNMEIRLNGNLMGTIPDQKKLYEGQIFQLPDGSALKVQLVKTWLSSVQLRVLRNDKPLSSGPTSKLVDSVFLIYFIAFLNIVLGSIALILQVEFLQTLGFGIFSMIMGVIFLVLGVFTQHRSLIALIIAFVIWGLDSMLALLNSAQPLFDGFIAVAALIRNSASNTRNLLGIADILMAMVLLIAILIIRLAFLIVLGKGVGAINKLKKGTLPALS